MLSEKLSRQEHQGALPERVFHDVPFCSNSPAERAGDMCLVANIHSVLKYFRPSLPLERQHVAQLCGYQPQKGAWLTQGMLSLSELGLGTWWIEDTDLSGFVADPISFMEQLFPNPEALDLQLRTSNIPLEAERISIYLSRGLPFQQRKGTVTDIKTFLANTWLVRLPVNAAILSAEKDFVTYDPHSVLVVGYEETGAIIHDASSTTGNIANRFVAWDKLEAAWDGYGTMRTLNAYGAI